MNPTDKLTVPPKSYAWPVRAITVLLFLQAIGLTYVAAGTFLEPTWEWGDRGLTLPPALTTPQANAIETALPLLLVALLAIIAAVGFFFLLDLGWLLAMMTQTLTLWICLIRYFQESPFFIFPVMLYCILIVLYLNSSAVRLIFHSPTTSLNGEGFDES